MLHSSMRMAEIANELGFNDESHLNRIFKKYKHVNPSDFRKKGALEKGPINLVDKLII
jgi:AraC-like DNA-binding protein